MNEPIANPTPAPTPTPIPTHPAPRTRFDVAVIGFLARYSSPATRAAYSQDLTLLATWCTAQALDPMDAQRVDLELFVRYLEAGRGNAPKTVQRRIGTLKSFFKLADFDGVLVGRDPAAHLRRPRVFIDETKILGLDRHELGALVAQAAASSVSDAALVTLMGLLGLRVSEACNLRIEDIHGSDRGHRVLSVVGKGRKPATIPLPPLVARTLDAAAGERTRGWLLLRADGQQMDRRAATRVVVRLAKQVHITKHVHPHMLRRSFVTAALEAGSPLRDVQIAARHSDIRMTLHYDCARRNLDRHSAYLVAAYIAGAA